MRESFSQPKKSKEAWRKETKEGIYEFLNSPQSKEGLHPELIESYEIPDSEKPLRREDLEREVRGFIEKNLEKLLPIFLLADDIRSGSYWNNRDKLIEDYSEVIKKLKITNEEIGLLGLNYYIQEAEGQLKIFKSDEFNPEGHADYNLEMVDLLALAYAKENIRIDTLRESGRMSGDFPHRYYLKSENRYLSTNDFGMKFWDEEEERMVDGNPTNISSFIRTVIAQIGGIKENISLIADEPLSVITDELTKQAEEERGGRFLDNREYLEVRESARVKASQEIVARLITNPKEKELILTAVPFRKVKKNLHFYFDRIAKKYGFLSDDPVADYQNFNRNAVKLEKLFRFPSEKEKAETMLNYVYFDFYKKPVIVGKDFDKQPLINEARAGVQDVLMYRAIEKESEEIRNCFEKYRCNRTYNSCYFYHDHKIYDLIKTIGSKKVQEILSSDLRNISDQLVGIETLKAMGYNILRMEADQLRKQVYEIEKFRASSLWEYLKEREYSNLEQEQAKPNKTEEKEHWFELFGKKQSRDFFREGKRMYWLAQQVWQTNPLRGENDRFRNENFCIDWSVYDLRGFDISEEKLNKHLKENRNLIIALLRLSQEKEKEEGEEAVSARSSVTLGLIIEALDRGEDLRGIILANDKQRYLKSIIKGEGKNDLEFAIADWPADWLKTISKEEINFYYEYADEYFLPEPNRLIEHVEWRVNNKDEYWNEIFKEVPRKKSDLDFRICLSTQEEEVRNWFKEAAEYVGARIMQNYLLRFNATKNSDGYFMDWHDTLFWVSNIKKLKKGDARSVINSIETVDENRELINFLPRYSEEQDQLKERPIQSLRELVKRVLALESDIDISSLPPEISAILVAPGFNLTALNSMYRRENFRDLLEGRLDKEQPFQPYKRLFTERSLTEALREGLGSFKEKIRGTAINPKGLFYDLNQLIKGREIEGRKMQVSDLLNSIPVNLEEEIIKLLQNQKVNLGAIAEAQVHAKSDPEGWVCGNYTDCCMSFGRDINNDYMFNPGTQYFTVKYNDRIIAQSVVVDSYDVRDNKDVILLDNIEVANNYTALNGLLDEVYKKFWTEYTSLPVKIGTGFSDLIPSRAELERNNYQPKRSLMYSDAGGPQIYNLPKLHGVETLERSATFSNLSERDAKLIAQMEAEVYPEGMAQGESYIRELFKKQRALEVPGAVSSFLIREGGEPAGYLLVLPEESEVVKGENVAHIYDMVILPKFRGRSLARKMMERVLEGASAYGFNLELEARGETSYPLLINERIRKWLESKGFYLTRNEKLPEYLGGEDFYFLRFENKQNTERIE